MIFMNNRNWLADRKSTNLTSKIHQMSDEKYLNELFYSMPKDVEIEKDIAKLPQYSLLVIAYD